MVIQCVRNVLVHVLIHIRLYEYVCESVCASRPLIVWVCLGKLCGGGECTHMYMLMSVSECTCTCVCDDISVAGSSYGVSVSGVLV